MNPSPLSSEQGHSKFEAAEGAWKKTHSRWQHSHRFGCDCCGDPCAYVWEYGILADGTVLERRRFSSAEHGELVVVYPNANDPRDGAVSVNGGAFDYAEDLLLSYDEYCEEFDVARPAAS